MKIHLSQQPHVRADQLRVLKMGMIKWSEEIKKLYPTYHGKVSLHYWDADTVEITPIIGQPIQRSDFEESASIITTQPNSSRDFSHKGEDVGILDATR